MICANPLIRNQLLEAGFLRVLTPKLPQFTASLRGARKAHPPGPLPTVLPSGIALKIFTLPGDKS